MTKLTGPSQLLQRDGKAESKAAKRCARSRAANKAAGVRDDLPEGASELPAGTRTSMRQFGGHHSQLDGAGQASAGWYIRSAHCTSTTACTLQMAAAALKNATSIRFILLRWDQSGRQAELPGWWKISRSTNQFFPHKAQLIFFRNSRDMLKQKQAHREYPFGCGRGCSTGRGLHAA